MNNDEIWEMGREHREQVEWQIASFVAGEISIERVDQFYRMRALVERLAAAEARIAWLEGAFMQAINAAEGDASKDAANDIEF